jgi:chromosome segregation ATPase
MSDLNQQVPDLVQQVPDVDSEDEFPSLPREQPAPLPLPTQPRAPQAPQVPELVAPPATTSNADALQKIEADLQSLLTFVGKNETLVNNLEDQLKANQQRIKNLESELARTQNEKQGVESAVQENQTKQQELEQRLQKSRTELELLQKNVAKLEAERDSFSGENQNLNKRIEEMQRAIDDGSGASATLQQDLDTCRQQGDELQRRLTEAEAREATLQQEKESTRNAIQRIQGQINTINDRVKMQTARLNSLGVQSGSGKNPFVYLRNKMQIVMLNRKLNKASRKKLNSLAKAWHMAPERFAAKVDLLRALKVVLHCKLGFVKRKSQLKVVAKNMNIDLKDKKNKGKDICEVILRKINRVSVKKAQELLK